VRAGTRRLAVLLTVGLFGSVGCGPPTLSGSQQPTLVAQGNAVPIPRDLDALVWLDLSRLSSIVDGRLGPTLAGILADLHGLAPESGSRVLYEQVVERARRVWLGCRPTERGCEDIVLVAAGDYGDFHPTEVLKDLGGPLDVGGGWERYDRRAQARTCVARVYLAPPERVVLVSHAEVDAVERLVERGLEPTDLVVKERGVVSLGIRPAALAKALSSRSSAAARWLSTATHLELTVEIRSFRATLTAILRFETPDVARRASRAMDLLLLALAEDEPRLKGLGIRTVAEDAQVRITVPFPRAPAPGQATASEPAAPADLR
jgi:hypothetical protein